MDTKKTTIQARLKAVGYSQTRMAEYLRCSLPFLNQVITGKRFNKRINGSLAYILGSTVAELWPEQKNTRTPADRQQPVEGDVGRASDPSRDLGSL